MHGSAYVAGIVAQTLLGVTAVTDAVGDRIDRRWIPQSEDGFITPFIVYRMYEPAIDDAPIGSAVTNQTIRFEVAVYSDGPGVMDILPVADAFHQAIEAIDYTVPGKGWHITCRRESELPDLDMEYGLPFVRVGGIYAFDVG